MRKTIFQSVLLLLAMTPPAWATLTVTSSPVPPSQVSTTSQAEVGLSVRGETSNKTLTVGGGYTLTCEGQVNGPVEAKNSVNQTNIVIPGIILTVTVPPTTPARYAIQGWSSWTAGSIHDCSFKYRGAAVEAATGITGSGWGFTFSASSGGVEVERADTAQFSMIKPLPRPGGGCEPFCTCTP
jgi:hypothetical protein